MALSDTITTNETTIQGYANALSADSVSPQKSYNLDGEVVDRDKWRSTLIAAITDLTAANEALRQSINNQSPYWVTTHVR